MFTSTAYDPDGDIVRQTWDLDGDGRYDDAAGAQAQRAFAGPGRWVVGVRVVDSRGRTDAARRVVTVAQPPAPPPAPPAPPPPPPPPGTPPPPPPGGPNAAPGAAFTLAPWNPAVGESVTLTSRSRDPDGAIADLRWDLDQDGEFDDAAGPVVGWTFPRPGAYTVSLMAEDDRGAIGIAFQTVFVRLPAEQVASPPAATGAGRTAARRTLLAPFPVVRIRGVILGRGVRVDLLTVTAARGAAVIVRCRGRGCPRRVVRARISRTGRPVRIRLLERALPAGAVIEVRVIKSGWVGKYTRFVIRRGAPPARRDLCVRGARARPAGCPPA